MSNVLYLCPEGPDKCGRLFAAPGGTTIKCLNHPEVVYMQAEDYGGADFFYIDEDGNTQSKGHVSTAGVTNLPPTDFHDAPPPTDTVPKEQIIEELRADYQRLSGRVADKRWGEDRLREEVAWEEEQLRKAAEITPETTTEPTPTEIAPTEGTNDNVVMTPTDPSTATEEDPDNA